MRNKRVALYLLLCTFSQLNAQTVIPLYEGKAPGSENWNWDQQETTNSPNKQTVLYNISKPTLVAYLPPASSAVGTAVIIAPGGGFHTIGIDFEAADIARWLNSKGIAAFVLRYRLVHCETNDPFAEVQRALADRPAFEAKVAAVLTLAIADGLKAVDYVRTHAEAFNISPQRVGMMGFSAGGRVVMGTVYRSTAANRPDFAAPFYSNRGIFRDEPVPADAPPLFIAAASDDDLGLASHSSNLYEAWIAAKKSAELHIYEKGGHAFASRKQDLPVDTWRERFDDWLDTHGWLWPYKPTGFYATSTPAKAKQLRKDEADRLKPIGPFRNATPTKTVSYPLRNRAKTGWCFWVAPALKTGKSLTRCFLSKTPLT